MACGVGISDEFSALYLVIGVLAALAHRHRTGEGQRVSVNLFASTLAAQQQELTVYLNHGTDMRRPTANVGHVGATAPFGIYETSDGHLALAMMPCPRLGEVLGVDWLDEFDTNEKMFAQRDRVHGLLSAHFKRAATAEWLLVLDEHDVWCAPVSDYGAVERDPQVEHLGLIWEVPVGDDGQVTFRTVGSPLGFSRTPAAVHRGVPRAGEHTALYFPVTGAQGRGQR
jgi:crotonobetainyl-CoA:carnitine CoA-transferase CaiB-like acyl-CoA transferase